MYETKNRCMGLICFIIDKLLVEVGEISLEMARGIVSIAGLCQIVVPISF
jgi:hypothetical protein